MSDTTIVKYEKSLQHFPIPTSITSAKDMELASKARIERKTILKAADAEKQKVLKPLNAARAAEQARWKPLETRLEEEIETLDRGMTKYQTEQQRIADAAAEKIAARVKEGKGNLKPETASRKLAEIDAPASVIASDAGATGFRAVPCFEVMDLTLLPIEYILANESMIRSAMIKGIELPGVRYFVEQRPVNK